MGYGSGYSKKDMFFAKATVDDLVAIEMVMKRPVQAILEHDDAESMKIMEPDIPVDRNKSIWHSFVRHAKGPRITKPKHIFLIVGESYTQAPFDPCYGQLHLIDGGKVFRSNPHTMCVNHFLPAGMVSQPAITSLIAGILMITLKSMKNGSFGKGRHGLLYPGS